MDYEKEYKEARDRAIKIIIKSRALSTEANFAVSYALSYVFPTAAGDKSEDERIRTRLIALVEAFGQGKYKDEMLAYLEKQKEQQPAEWSEEDKRMLDIILTDVNYAHKNYSDSKLTSYDKKVSWLKSLRPQLHWKPTEEQMTAFEIAKKYTSIHTSDEWLLNTLESIFNDLKNLI